MRGKIHKNDFDGGLRFGTGAFMARAGRIPYVNKLEEAQKLFLDEEGLLKEDLAQERACPVCEGADRRLAFVKKGFSHWICKSCGMFYVSPILKADESLEDYAESERSLLWVDVQTNDLTRELAEKKFHYALNRLEEASGRSLEGKKVLDVGCGAGTFLKVVAGRMAEPFGVELNRRACELLRREGVTVHNGTLAGSAYQVSTFDVFTLWDVLEHVDRPMDLLRTGRRLLKTGGLLMVEVPNLGGLAARILRDACSAFSGESHINMFTPSMLTRVLTETGFEVIHLETYVSELNTIANYMDYQPPYGGSADYRQVLPFLSPEWVHENLLGHRLFAIGRKRMLENPGVS